MDCIDCIVCINVDSVTSVGVIMIVWPQNRSWDCKCRAAKSLRAEHVFSKVATSSCHKSWEHKDFTTYHHCGVIFHLLRYFRTPRNPIAWVILKMLNLLFYFYNKLSSKI